MTGRLAAVIGGILVVFAGMTQTLVVGVVGIIGLAMIFYGIYKLTRKKITINTTEKIQKMKTLRQISDRNDTLLFFRRADFLIPFAIATALIISVGVASAVDLERGLVAYYSFDDCSAKDLSGNENDGIIYGAKCVDGKFGKALSFDGVDDYVDIEGSFLTNFDGENTLTAAAWVNIKGNGVGCCDPIVAQRDERGWALRYDERDAGAEIEFIVHNNAGVWVGDKSDFGAPLPSFGDWHLIAGVLDKNQLRLYVDGVLVDTAYFSGVIDSMGTEIDIGSACDGYFNGIIDEVRIYNRALSEEEIRALYERGVAPRPKLAIEMDIDTSLKQGEVRKGTIRVENIGNSDAKSVEVRLFSEGLGIDVEKSYAKIPSGEAREFLFEVSANEAGTFKLSAYAEYWDDKGKKYVETADKFVHVEAVVLPTSQPTSQAQKTPEARETARPAGFYAIFASLLMAVSYFLMIRLRGKKN